MTSPLPDELRSWLDAGEFATLATVLPGGQPHLSVLWATYDGGEVLMSTVAGRVKHRNLSADPRASLLCCPRAEPYRYVELRGSVTMTTEGGRELIDRLSERYTGTTPFPGDGPEAVRAVLRLRPDHAVVR
ncbi:MAG: PPOX class F420-dependent oxidoreductase [Mycobacteriales bacterium]